MVEILSFPMAEQYLMMSREIVVLSIYLNPLKQRYPGHPKVLFWSKSFWSKNILGQKKL